MVERVISASTRYLEEGGFVTVAECPFCKTESILDSDGNIAKCEHFVREGHGCGGSVFIFKADILPQERKGDENHEKPVRVEAEDELDEAKALQQLINAGAWGYEGSVGRTMMDAIRSGVCLLGREGHRDYWSNYVPSRTEVQAGTKGSREFVAERSGEDWLAEIETVE